MTLNVQVYSDYVCPYCFLAEAPLNEAVAEFSGEVVVEWMPFELRPYPTATLEPTGDYLVSGWRDSIYPLAEKMGVHIVLPRVSPQPYTRLAFEGALFAREHGKAAIYNHRMFTAFFQDELDIGDVTVLTECVGALGLDQGAFRTALEDRVYSEECAKQLNFGREALNINSVPTFVIDNRFAIPGMASKSTLVTVFGEQLAKTE